MRHVVIQDKDCIRSIDVNRITSSAYLNGKNYFNFTILDNIDGKKAWTFTFEDAEAALDAYEEFLNIIQEENC